MKRRLICNCAAVPVFTILFSLLSSSPLAAQEQRWQEHCAREQWTLDRCIGYALEHSNEVRQQQLQVESGEININTARMSRLPDLSASLGGNIYFGRGPSRDGTYIDNSQISGSFGVSTSIPVFQGLRIKHEIDRSKLDFEAATSQLELVRENISLQITSFFLQALYTRELVKISESQLELSTSQLELARGRYESGKSSHSDVIDNESVVASDQASLTQSKNNYILALLDLRQAMNLPDSVAFEPYVELEKDELPEYRLLPSLEEVYEASLLLHPSIKVAQLNLESSHAALKGAKSSYYPSLHFTAGYGNSAFSNLTDRSLNSSFWTQLSNNGNEYVGLSLSIPIFSRNAVRNNVKLSELNVRNYEIALNESQKALKKEIEQAYWGAMTAYDAMVAAKKALDAARLAFENELVKYQAGKSGVYDYSNAKANLDKAEATLSHSKYDYILKYRILKFYM